MRYSTRLFLAATTAVSLAAAALPQSASAFDDAQLKCRSTIAKSGGKFSKTVAKALTGCHKDRDKNGPDSRDCNAVATADTKSKVPDAAAKFHKSVDGKCTTGTPDQVLYVDCPAPCNDDVPAITTFTNLVDCLTCLGQSNGETWSDEANTDPTAPMTNEAEASCHKSITKNGSKLYNSVIKTVAKCQANFEKNGSEMVSTCVGAGFPMLTDEAYNKAQAAIFEDCSGVTLPSATLDPCGGEATTFDLSVCVAQSARNRAQQIVTQYLILPDGGSVTTTTTTLETTTTTLDGGGGHPQCPAYGELVLFAKTTNQVCATNSDCTAPRFCDQTTLRCSTVADLDSGWNGAGHDADINDQAKATANLLCPGPPSPGCGECTVTGLSAAAGNCRCANNILTKCDEPFVADADDCAGNVCNCYFGAPFPLSAAGTPVCVSNRFSQDITGTANVDLGSGVITASLRTQVFLGYTRDFPCPVCGGKCSNDQTGCIFNSDCDGGATCVQDVPGDGVRNGVCVLNPATHLGNGVACDIDGQNSSFPAILGDTTPGQGGGGYSIDCQPEVGKNVSGAGLKISLTQSTGVTSLSAGLDCDGSGPETELCPCLVCSTDTTEPCDSNADCLPLGGTCAGAPNNGGIACSVNGDCAAADVGPCQTVGMNKLCRKKQALTCTTNADCQAVPVGPCNVQTCTSKGGIAGEPAHPNNCSDDICTDEGGGEGTCANGPVQMYCDALVKADGAGISTCSSDADCTGGYGNCTISDEADCFLDPIVATGDPDPDFPVAGAVFCIPPTSNGGINSSAGLPGPGRVMSQGSARTFCKSNPLVEYNPGGTPACP